MYFISTAAHQKFIEQCHLFISSFPSTGDAAKAEILKTDLNRLQKLVEDYMKTFSQLPELSREYNDLQRSIRVKMRRMQIQKTDR